MDWCLLIYQWTTLQSIKFEDLGRVPVHLTVVPPMMIIDFSAIFSPLSPNLTVIMRQKCLPTEM
jgi:hypothetical protein